MKGVDNSGRAFPRYLLTGVLGAMFALCLYPVWDLEGRWFVIAIVGIALVSISMVFAGRFSNFLLIVLLFCVPLAGFAKWLFLDDYSDFIKTAAPLSGALSLGLFEFLIVGLYFAWAFRIFVLREEPMPRLEKIDAPVAVLVVSSAVSLWGAAEQPLGIFSLGHLLKHAMIYFYVSRNFKRTHLPWFMASIAFAILVEAIIGILQYGQILPPGLMRDKGAGSDRLEQLYDVTGIEDISRAHGTTYDSHALGIYLSMLMHFALVFLYKSALPARMRLGSGLLLLLGFAGLVASYSRSAWLSFAISAGFTVLVLIAWRERYALMSTIFVVAVGLITAPWVFAKLFARLFEADSDALLGRFDQYTVAWTMWRENFLFGVGAGNYNMQLEHYNMNWAIEGPVHNVILLIGSETGLFGVIAFYGLITVVLYNLWRLIRLRHEPDCRFALAAFGGLLAFTLDGLTNPLFREATVYMQFWLTVALSVALAREAKPRPPVISHMN
ncbi:MAG: O-antigen ligase family protein [Propionivibrio sp.]|nr:O-antigen ligase family protein [Propionivibrio sp.]